MVKVAAVAAVVFLVVVLSRVPAMVVFLVAVLVEVEVMAVTATTIRSTSISFTAMLDSGRKGWEEK